MSSMEQNKKIAECIAGSKGKACFSEKFCFILVCDVSKISWVGLRAVKAALCGMESLRGRHQRLSVYVPCFMRTCHDSYKSQGAVRVLASRAPGCRVARTSDPGALPH